MEVNKHSYCYVYEHVFAPLKDKKINILEIGIGTLIAGIPSTFAGNVIKHPQYMPGGSLRGMERLF